MFKKMNPFVNKTDMESVVNVTRTLMDKNSNSWSRMSPNFHPIGVNPANKKFDSYLNFRELLSKSSTILLQSMLKP